jgi:hypothetical protein
MTPILDMVQRGLGRLIERWKDDPVLTALVRMALSRFQEAENAAQQVATLRGIDTASGQQLDNLGALVGQQRQGMSDADYRLRIRARLLINRSSGTTPELIAVFELLAPPGAVIAIRNESPATVVAAVDGAAVPNAPELNAVLQTAKAGGVRAILESSPADGSGMFIWNSSTAGQRWNEGVWGSAIGDD